MPEDLRRTTPSVFFSGFRFEPGSERLWRDDVELPLRPKTAAVLGMLVGRAGEVVTKRELLDVVWPEGFVGDAVLAVCVNELRQLLADDARNPRYIATAHRRGYRFVASVSAAPPPVSDQLPVAGSVEVGRRGLPFVGRADELAALDSWWEQARGGNRQLVFFAAAAGVGKTTLFDVFLDRVRQHGHALIGRGQCVEQFTEGEAYFPVLDVLGAWCRGPDGDRVRAVLESSAPTWLLQLPGALDPAGLDSLRLRTMGSSTERMLRELLNAFEALAAWRPVLLVLEDLHYGDRSTTDLLSYLARRQAPARLLVAVTYRPAEVVARSHPVGLVVRDLRARGECQYLPLELLAAPAVEEYLVRRLAPRRPSPGLVAEVHDRTGGNALFVQTLVDYLIVDDLLDDVGGEVHNRARLDLLGVPESVRQFIERQIESLAEDDRRLLEAAAAAGLEFSTEAVAAALNGDTPGAVAAVEEQCERLAERSALLSDAGAVDWPDGTITARYRFVHAMYQEVLYDHLRSPARRATVHRQIGARISAGYGADTHQVAAELAMHFERGRDFPRAIEHHAQAAETALSRSAHQEALLHTSRAFELLDHIPSGEAHARGELRIRLIEGSALIAARWFGSRAVHDAYAAARPLADEVGDVISRVVVLSGLWSYAIMRADLVQATGLAAQLEELSQPEGDPQLKLQIHSSVGQTHLFAGEPATASTHFDQVLSYHDPGAHWRLSLLYGEDPAVFGRLCGAFAAWLLGRPDTARDHVATALGLARARNYPAVIARALWHASVVHELCGDAARVRVLTSELADVCGEYDLPMWAPIGKILNAWSIAETGDRQVVAAMEEGLAEMHAPDRTLTWPYHASLVSRALAGVGEADAALDMVVNAVKICRSTGERWYEAELVRLHGELLPTEWKDDAEQHFLEAREIARQQHARSFELRAVTSLGGLWHAHGETSRARAVVAELYHSFTEGHDTADLIAASALLEKLSE